MAIIDGQAVNAAVTNAAFMSKTNDSSTVGKVGLLNADVISGDNITNLQKELNEKTFTAYSVQAVAAAATIDVQDYKGLQARTVIGSPGAVTVSTTPFGNSFILPSGTIVAVSGADNTNTVKITHNDINYGCLLFGDADLEAGFIVSLI